MRIQLDIPTGKDERIKQWMKEAGFKTYSELFNNTMSVFTWVANEVKHGRIVISQDPSGQTLEKQFSMPFMDVLAPMQPANQSPAQKSLAASS
jgi:hypothetical protein